MITLYSGTPGSGKSLDLAELLYYRIKNTRTVTIGNVKLNLDNIKGKRRGWYFYLPDHRMIPERFQNFTQKYCKHYKKRIKEGMFLIVIDEAQRLFNARDWSAAGRRGWNEFFTLHRHYGFDIIMAAQFDRMLDRQVRCLFEYEWIHRKVTNYGIPGKILFILCGGPLFVCVKIWYPMKEKSGSRFFRFHRKYARIYDTFEKF